MTSNQAPEGLLFSRLYVERGTPRPDSMRMRRRLRHMFGDLLDMDFADLVRRELGVALPDARDFTWTQFFENAETRDILDTITLMHRYIYEVATRRGGLREAERQTETFDANVARVFSEEHLHYRVDNEGGVHFSIDIEFERNRASSIEALGAARYAAALDAFEGAHAALDRHPQDRKEALRKAFEAVEIVFKLSFPAGRLGSAEIKQHLLPVLPKHYANDVPGTSLAAQKLANSLIDWVEGVHFYRHGQAIETAQQPPLDLTVALVSASASYLRWLAELDHALQA